MSKVVLESAQHSSKLGGDQTIYTTQLHAQ